MADLHPEVEALFKTSPTCSHGNYCEADVRRIAALAVEKEREGMRDAIADEIMEADATWSRGEAMDVATQAIRRRGKP